MSFLGFRATPGRQLASPNSTRFLDLRPPQDLTQDNKDVLIERLNDLVHRIMIDDNLENKAITSIHRRVDDIELDMRKDGSHRKQASSVASEIGDPRDEDHFWGPLTPTGSIRMRLPEATRSPLASVFQEPELSPSKAEKIAKEAEELSTQLSKVVAELQARREESDHIHDMLVLRAEKAAEHKLLLEYRISEMEDDFESNQSELKYLRIQLQAIEAQCSEYIYQNSDEELSTSIERWKIDWEAIDRKSKARRKCQISVTDADGTTDIERVLG